ncbi:MAG: hypothetical protein EF812_05620 [Methanosarcinales archaeon]|nr:MAG: hypothetical protein EF812_05620 [Methanosarcinales archaeon]
MDKEFFSTANMVEMVSSELSFIIPTSSTLKSVKEAMSEIHASIYNPNNLEIHQDEPLFVMPVTIDIGELNMKGYAYYDQKREQQERKSFFKRLYGVVERLQSIQLRSWMCPAAVFKETAKKSARYINWTVEDNGFEVSLKKNAVSQRFYCRFKSHEIDNQ